MDIEKYKKAKEIQEEITIIKNKIEEWGFLPRSSQAKAVLIYDGFETKVDVNLIEDIKKIHLTYLNNKLNKLEIEFKKI